MAKTDLEYIRGQWCVVNDDTGEKKGQARPKERETSREESEFDEEEQMLGCRRCHCGMETGQGCSSGEVFRQL